MNNKLIDIKYLKDFVDGIYEHALQCERCKNDEYCVLCDKYLDEVFVCIELLKNEKYIGERR